MSRRGGEQAPEHCPAGRLILRNGRAAELRRTPGRFDSDPLLPNQASVRGITGRGARSVRPLQGDDMSTAQSVNGGAASGGTVAGPARRSIGLALVVIAMAQLMVVLDATIVNVALPDIQRALGFSGSGLEWVVNAYTLTFGGLLLLGGRAGDIL